MPDHSLIILYIELTAFLVLMMGAAEVQDEPLLCSGGAVTSSPSAPWGEKHSTFLISTVSLRVFSTDGAAASTVLCVIC